MKNGEKNTDKQVCRYTETIERRRERNKSKTFGRENRNSSRQGSKHLLLHLIQIDSCT